VQLELSEIGDGSPITPRMAELLSYTRDLAAFLAGDMESASDLAAAAGACLEGLASHEYPLAFRAIDDFRHVLMRISGQAPADWDLHDFVSPRGRSEESLKRSFLPGLKVYLEDIRSPFNVGTILRTAEALGFEEVLLSAGCADPRHPRALRSSMGAVDLIPWRRCSPEELEGFGPVFALELGGLPLDEFPFPSRGLLVLGSEELGVSAACLGLADGRRVSIPMRGIKASINVAVAFGIAAQAWVSTISR
jgi:TrmH family RNA methyltransferase